MLQIQEMNSCNFILLFSALFFFAGTFGYRFDRHSTTKNGMIENEKIGEGIHLLSADKEAPTVSDGENVTLTGSGNAHLQLTQGELQFELCTPNCMGQIITACYDAVNPNPLLQGNCLLNRCQFKAEVFERNEIKRIEFNGHSKPFTSKICEWVKMRSPEAEISFRTPRLDSCKPNITDGNVINLSVTFVGPTSECHLKVLNAKKWIPSTTPAPLTSESPQIASTEEKEDSSSALLPLWIVLGIFLFVLVVAVIVIGILCWCKQKKTSAAPAVGNGVKANKALTENKTKTDGGNAFEETVAKTEASKPKVSDAKEKKEIVEQPKQAMKPKIEEKAVQEKQPKEDAQVVPVPAVDDPIQKPSAEPSKPSAEPSKTSAKPNVQDATTEPSAVQPIRQHLKGPKIDIPTEPVVPRPSLYHKRSQSGSRSHIRDSLSGVHDPAMHLLVESQPGGLERLCDTPGLIEEQKLDRFYPSTKCHLQPPQNREKALFCASDVYALLENVDAMRIDAQDALADVGVKFDQNMEIESMPEEAVNYLRLPTTPEFVKSYAFGSLFRKLIDDNAPGNKIYSIPLLFAILLQHRYSIQNRREIAIFIRRELLIIDDEFSLKERSASAFPINAIEFAVQLDEMGFRNIASFLKRSGLANGKRGKYSGGGKNKKLSKK